MVPIKPKYCHNIVLSNPLIEELEKSDTMVPFNTFMMLNQQRLINFDILQSIQSIQSLELTSNLAKVAKRHIGTFEISKKYWSITACSIEDKPS
jgi:hypothetical protein